MARNTYPVILSALSPFLLATAVRSQGELRPIEKALLTAISTDTTSRLTAYLPPEYRFGLTALPEGRFILVKDGRSTRLLLEGTHRVYELIPEPSSPRISRIDSTLFQGDNFSPIAFWRKDTLMQFGGRGRFTQRDFFTRYREGNCDWELFPNNGRSLENAWTLHQYVPSLDQLWVLGRRVVDSRNLGVTILDTVYRFEFRTSRWTAMGRIHPRLPYRPFLEDMAHLAISVDGGTLLQADTGMLWVDIARNRWHWIPSHAWDASPAIRNGESVGRPLLLILADSLHAFYDGKQGAVHLRYPFPHSPGLKGPMESVYLAVDDREQPRTAITIALVAAACTGMGILAYRKRRRPESHHDSPSGDDRQEEDAWEKTTPKPGMERFLTEAGHRLSPMEWQLLRQLIHLSAQGKDLGTAELNDTLGITAMEPSVRKTRRTNAVVRLNRLFKQTVTGSEPLVFSERDTADGRSFRYHIRQDISAALRDAMPGDA